MNLSPGAVALFSELQSSKAHPAVAGWLRRTATEGADFDGFKINAFRVAEEIGVSRLDATRAFLFATRIGITDLTWDVHCPMCRSVPAYHRHLMDLPQRAHCTFCTVRWDLRIEEQLEATFTFNPGVRRIDPEQFAVREHPRDMDQLLKSLNREGRRPLLGVHFQKGGVSHGEITLAAGEYMYSVPGDDEGPGRLHVAGAPSSETQLVRLAVTSDGHLDQREVQLRPGPVRLEVHSQHPRDEWGLHLDPAGDAHNWVSATYVTSLQDFRDLFAGEFLAPDRSFAIRSITLLFTDITGSTQMYERLGDARAYALVQQHFELMADVIRRNEGGIVKTIGDAVMAAFSVNANAVRAAMEIQLGFAEVSEPLNQIAVKIGLHRGPTIAVTSNRMIDYFGRTVNIAARVQGASDSGEVLVSEPVLGDPDAARWIEEEAISSARRTVAMKGIDGPVPVFSLRPHS